MVGNGKEKFLGTTNLLDHLIKVLFVPSSTEKLMVIVVVIQHLMVL